MGFWAGLGNIPSNHLSALSNWSWWVLGLCPEHWETKGEHLSSGSLDRLRSTGMVGHHPPPLPLLTRTRALTPG